MSNVGLQIQNKVQPSKDKQSQAKTHQGRLRQIKQLSQPEAFQAGYLEAEIKAPTSLLTPASSSCDTRAVSEAATARRSSSLSSCAMAGLCSATASTTVTPAWLRSPGSAPATQIQLHLSPPTLLIE